VNTGHQPLGEQTNGRKVHTADKRQTPENADSICSDVCVPTNSGNETRTWHVIGKFRGIEYDAT